MISLVITSYTLERRQDISDLLKSINAQTNHDYEVVYVTEKDIRLHEFVRNEIGKYAFKSKVIHNSGGEGLAEARNLGASAATGDIVAFVDDDVVLGEGWVAAVEGAFHSFPEAVGVTGPAYPLWVGEKVDWLPPEFDWLIGCTKWFRSEHVVEVRNCWGMNMAFSLKYFEDVGGFSPATGYHRGKMPEDLELSLRIRRVTGKKLLYVPDMRVWNKIHPYRLSHKYIVARSSYIGYTRRAIPQNIPNGESAYIFEFSTLASILNSLRPSVIASSRTHLLPLTRITILAMVSIFLGYVFGPFE